jgi:type I restriction enzyme, R subunit
MQSEQALEQELVAKLQTLGYALVPVRDEASLLANLKTQLEKHNNVTFSATEYSKVLNLLNKGSVFEKAHTLRQKQHLVRDNGDNLYFEFLNTEHWCQNQYQVTHQVAMSGRYDNRYDVTLLINGLPLVQIELKKRGLEMKEAFNQINRYQKHSFGAGQGLFQFVQIFVISNGVNTKYFGNFGIHPPEFLQTFHWTNEDNRPLNNILNGFAESFLEPCHLSKMICKYIVLHETDKKLMVLRPYQFYAVENILQKVRENEVLHGYDISKNGYIWHTTGSGKTLTSFKASQILSQIPAIRKVVFVVDRRDLDYQTNQEYDKFSKDCVSAAGDTTQLIRQFNDPTVRIIVTTIQKLNNAIAERNRSKMSAMQDQRMVFIFDECHRSQFGDTHRNIVSFFQNIQLFGFTGTPILAKNAVETRLIASQRTTASLFGRCLHKYVITDAIRDENVLRFSVEYISTFRQKDHIVDLKVEQINEKEVFESPERKQAIVDYIIQNHAAKTQERTYCAMMCVQDIDAVIQYYELFKARKAAGAHDLKVATIFSFAQNEDEMDYDIKTELSVVEEPRALYGLPPHRRELLDAYIADFNQLFGTAHSTRDGDSFYRYYNDISKKAKNKELDILLVANMFLTGFDSKWVNTLYVDKNLQYHGLVQAFSRTNRTHDKNKTQGNIVCFRNLKNKTDEAITLFSNKDALDEVLLEPYETYVQKFNDEVKKLLQIAPTVQSVDDLYTEEERMKFILSYRALMRLHKKMGHFTEFSWDDLGLDAQTFADYGSKYQDLKDHITQKSDKTKVSILQDIDFELELIRRDNINVTYIIQLLIRLQSQGNKADREATEKLIFNLLNTEVTLRSKRALIEKFIHENLARIGDIEDLSDAFALFWEQEERAAFDKLVQEEGLSASKTAKLIEDYLFSEQKPLRDDVLSLIEGEKPGILQRREVGDRIVQRIVDFVEVFREGT